MNEIAWIIPITDRTQTDVNLSTRLLQNFDATGYDSFTPEEKAAWDSGLRGMRNYTDLQRITGNIHYLAGVLNGYGYSVTPTSKTNWAMDVPRYADVNKIRIDLENISKTFVSVKAIPDLPLMSYQKLNDVEQIIFETRALISNMAAAFIHSGTTYSGQGGIRT